MKQLLWQLSRKAKKILGGSDYEAKISNEIAFFSQYHNVHDLPEIFHYWSNKHLLPIQQRFGFNGPDDFFITQTHKHYLQSQPDKMRIVSIGSGNGELEVKIAQNLKKNGIERFSIECVDINKDMLERTRGLAQESGVDAHIDTVNADFNTWRSQASVYDVVIANQSLHHVLELEHLFDAIKLSLKPDGSFMTSDMIGRNGHQRWPEALELMQPFWQELPRRYKYNRLLSREEIEYINHDCSSSGFEGIRAQDILPLLEKNFHFELFIPFANIIMVFIDRPFGHNFDATAEWDRDFIDRVHQADEAAILSGRIKPTQMLAVMKKKQPEQVRLWHPKLTPRFCIRWPD